MCVQTSHAGLPVDTTLVYSGGAGYVHCREPLIDPSAPAVLMVNRDIDARADLGGPADRDAILLRAVASWNCCRGIESKAIAALAMKGGVVALRLSLYGAQAILQDLDERGLLWPEAQEELSEIQALLKLIPYLS